MSICNDKFFTTAVQFRFQCESFKHQFDGFVFNFQRRILRLVVIDNR